MDKLMPGHVTIWLAYPEYAVDPLNPTAAEMNAVYAETPAASQGNLIHNVSCAITDDYTFNQTDSDTDDTRTICDVGEVANPTFQNFEVELNSLRDISVTDAGLYNHVAELTRGVDRPFYAIRRVGPAQADDVEVGQYLSIIGVTTDYPQDQVDSGALLLHGARFKMTGEGVIEQEVTA